MHVELLFRLIGAKTLPIDHAHGLYGALKRLVPALEKIDGLGIHTFRGTPLPDGTLLVDPHRTKLRLRLNSEDIPTALGLAGSSLDILGSRFSLGVPEVHPLTSHKALWSRIVTLKFDTTEGDAARLQLAIHLEAAYPGAMWAIRRPRTIRIHGKQILGFETLGEGFSPDESLRLQEEGIGGRRKFGCGLFVGVGVRNRV